MTDTTSKPRDGEWLFRPVAHIRTDFPDKFGIPRQSGLVGELTGKIVFEPTYRNPDAFRGIETYSHLWLLWQFSRSLRDKWQPMVRPPKLGGNTPVGVFATRSPFRPNPIGLSSVRLDAFEIDPALGPVLYVSGVDMADNTPIYDVKPYIPYSDCHPDAEGGFATLHKDDRLEVTFPAGLLERLPEGKRDAAIAVLSRDPRPSYQDDPDRVYGVYFADKNIRFTVRDGSLTVIDVEPMQTHRNPGKTES